MSVFDVYFKIVKQLEKESRTKGCWILRIVYCIFLAKEKFPYLSKCSVLCCDWKVSLSLQVNDLFTHKGTTHCVFGQRCPHNPLSIISLLFTCECTTKTIVFSLCCHLFQLLRSNSHELLHSKTEERKAADPVPIVPFEYKTVVILCPISNFFVVVVRYILTVLQIVFA